MDEVTLIDSFPTVNRDEQGTPSVPAEEDVPLSRLGRGRVILKNYYPYGNTKEEQNEVDKAGSSPTPDFSSDQAECITTITGSSGATDNPYNAGYDQLTRYGKFPKSSGQKRERRDPAPPLYGEAAISNRYTEEQRNSTRTGVIIGVIVIVVLLIGVYWLNRFLTV